jgi:hypothetical protein
MSRGTFHSHNKDNKVVTFYTNSSSGTTFDPSIYRNNLQKRFHWNLGTNYPTIALTSDTLTYTYQDGGNVKKVKLVGDTLNDAYLITINNDSIIGNVDVSQLKNLTGIDFSDNPQLTGVTYPITTSSVNVSQCNIIGNHDVSNITLNNAFAIHSNSNLTGVTHSFSTNNIFYNAYNCGLVGNLDLTMFPNLQSFLRVDGNSNLTSITHTASTNNFSIYWAYNCNLTGTHDMSMLLGLGGFFILQNNPNLTKILHTASTQTFSQYTAASCNLTGNHDVSMLNGIGGLFRLSANLNLTGVTHTASTEVINTYDVGNCNLIGNYDVSMFPNLGGSFNLGNNPNLTSVTHTASTQVFTDYTLSLCNMTGVHDVSMLTGLGGKFTIYLNSNLTSVNFPYSVGTFKNNALTQTEGAFTIYSCPSLGYVDFKPLSGATMDVNSVYGASIYLGGNGMSTTNINHILYDFSGITANNLNKWSGVTLDISGNSLPDSSTGGYDGISSINYLTGTSANWTIIL